jgi:hypothetical protein
VAKNLSPAEKRMLEKMKAKKAKKDKEDETPPWEDSKKKPAKTKDKPNRKLINNDDDEDEDVGDINGLVSKGYGEVKKNAERAQEAREKAGLRLRRMFFPDKNNPKYKNDYKRHVRFVTAEPINMWEHRVEGARGEFPEFITCTKERDGHCPICDVADGRAIGKARFMGWYLVFNRDSYTIKRGPREGEIVKDSLEVLDEGQIFLGQLDEVDQKWGLLTRDFEVTRTDQTKTILPADDEKAPMPKSLKQKLEEALETAGCKTIAEFIIKQIKLQTYTKEQLEEKFGTAEDSKQNKSKLRNFDDDDED